MDSSDVRQRLGVSALNVLSIIARPAFGAVETYRVTLPLSRALNGDPKLTGQWCQMQDLAKAIKQEGFECIKGIDLFVLNRMTAFAHEATLAKDLIDALRVYGAKIVYEVDDDYTGRYRVTPSGRSCLPYIYEVDAITVSTPGLASELQSLVPDTPIHVLPNYLPVEAFASESEKTTRTDQRLSIYVAGSDAHFLDWQVLEDVIPNLHKDFPDVRFTVAGCQPYYLDTEIVTFRDAVPFSQYPSMLADADIIVSPVDPADKFNYSKSPVKALEAWAARRPVGKHVGGAAFIGSAGKVYNSTVDNRHNGLLVRHTPEYFEAGLRKLIQDQHLRHRLQIEGYKDVHDHDIAQHWHKWSQAYRDVLAQGG